MMKRTILMLSFAVCAALSAFAQTGALQVADQVQTPDGRTGKIESFKPMSDIVKVQFTDGTSKFYVLADLKKVEQPKPNNTNPPENFRVGDTVITPDSPTRKLRIDSISGDTAVVRFGPGTYNTFKEKLSNLMSLQAWEQRQNAEKESKLVRAAFEDEAQPYMNTIRLLAHSFTPKIGDQGGSLDATPATREKWRKDLEALAAICQKYPNITNSPLADDPIYAGSINYWHGDWCRMAQQRDVAIKSFVKYVGSDQTKYTVNSIQILLNEAERDPDGYVGDELQTVLFDRAAWMKKNTQQYKTQFEMSDQEIETQIFAPLASKLGALKSKIESDATNLAAPLPKFSDAALEAIVKRRVASDYPGGQVLKVALDSANWSLRDGKRNIGSDSNGTEYYLRLKGAYRIRTGLALIRLPNQPFCQVRYVELTQPKKGAGFDAAWARLEPRGKFVKCQ